MTRKTVGGPLDYRLLATLHRPDDAQTLAREAVALLRLGLSISDVGQALGIQAPALCRLLAELDDQTDFHTTKKEANR
jgi:hypothetical protein